MYRSALRSTPRLAHSLRQSNIAVAGRRFASSSPSSPADKKRSWKSSIVRLGLAGGIIYLYNTSPVFAEEPQPQTIPPPRPFSDDDLPTVDAVVAQKRREAEARSRKAALESSTEPAPATSTTGTAPTAPSNDAEAPASGPPSVGGPQDLEEEVGQQGAFNPETGEINWDCPCLGGMAHGPCGEEFKAAFSCFVYSKEEPKGMDCIDKFQHMQDCFRAHPDVYGEELDDEETAPEEHPAEPGSEPATAKTAAPDPVAAPGSSAAGSPAGKPITSDRETGEAAPDRTRDATVPPKTKQ
ncbi:hypothetical protein F4780DRAFT_660594 [Xylariomycetidae sp. FL0641]|nr:hypothetical protein F4780DRAFT_660594 [Xylariomycetidae sp. FL0641]